MKKTIGIDVSQDFLDVASYNGQTFIGEHYSSQNLITFRKIIKDFSIDKNTLITMEATGVYHLQLAHYLHERGYLVSVVNPLKTKRFGQMKFQRAKTDKTDAKLIAQYAYEQSPSLYQPKAPELEELQVILKGIEDLHKMKLQVSNRLHALDKRVHGSKLLEKAFKNTLNTIKTQLTQLENMSIELAQSFAPDAYQKLIGIPSVGQKMATAIIAYYGQFENFESANQVVAFAGLNPNPRESGTSVKFRGSISKRGHAYLRKVAYMCALTANKCNPMCKALFERMVEKGKPKMVALVAVANKLLRQCFAVVKYGKHFDPEFAKKT